MDRRRLTLVAVVSLALLAAGCGGGGHTLGIASVASTTTSASTSQSGVVAYSRCMRAHGVSNFPDPDSSGGIPKSELIRLGVGKVRMRAAGTACEHLLPATGLAPPETAQQIRKRIADALSFANCMRSHGVAGFPDPTAQGQLTVEMVQAQGIDVHSPAILRVVQRCLPASHGALTAAKVREAINGTGH